MEFNITEQKKYYVNGIPKQWDGPVMKVYSPILTNGVATYMGSYPMMDKDAALTQLDCTIKAYDKGRGKWPCMSVENRCQYVMKFIKGMESKRKEVVTLLMWEIGKNFQDSCKEFDRTVEYLEETVKVAMDMDKSYKEIKNDGGILAQIKRAPLGVTLCMGPYNYPLNESLTTIIPALIAGNVVIAKPPKIGVLLHYPLLEVFMESFPVGVFNMVYGDGPTVISPLLESGKIDVLAFIGSSKVGDILKKQHPHPHRLRCVMGMEAKNPAIILRDADLSLTINECLAGALSYNGQRCTALKILFVHEYIVGDFVERFAKAVDGLKCGLPWEDGVQITPLPEPGKIDYLNGLIDDARKVIKSDMEAGLPLIQCKSGEVRVYGSVGTLTKNGKVVMNESWGEDPNYLTLFKPAVVFPVNEKMRLYKEEQFGPIVPIVPFKYESDVMDYIVNSNYGQQVSIFGNDPDMIREMTSQLVNQVCRVNINCQCQRGPDTYPFTGRKDSAEGTLSITDALRVFSIRTMVATKDGNLNKKLMMSL